MNLWLGAFAFACAALHSSLTSTFLQMFILLDKVSKGLSLRIMLGISLPANEEFLEKRKGMHSCSI